MSISGEAPMVISLNTLRLAWSPQGDPRLRNKDKPMAAASALQVWIAVA